MSIATKAPISETRIGFAGVGFDVYERLIRATPARTAVRMAYDGRNLEIMVTGPVHDDYGWFLDRFINVVARVVGVRRRALGKTTWIRPEIERGIEADQCYVFDPAKVSAVSELLARKENDVALYPNPDLAVEVDISRPQADRPAIYAALEVPELWTFDSERVTIARAFGRPVRRHRPEPMDSGHGIRRHAMAGLGRHPRHGRMGRAGAGLGRAAAASGRRWDMTSTVLAGLLLRQPFQPFRGRLSHPLFNRRRHRLDTSDPSQRPRPGAMKSWGCPSFPFVLELFRESAAKSPSPLAKGGYRAF